MDLKTAERLDFKDVEETRESQDGQKTGYADREKKIRESEDGEKTGYKNSERDS